MNKKQKPNFEPSGLLAKQTNSLNGVVLKYTIPYDSAFPSTELYRLYKFQKGTSEPVAVYKLHHKEHYLIGKDIRVCDIIIEEGSISRQHAVIQFKNKLQTDEFNNTKGLIIPYIIDLESTNGTVLNGSKIESARYYELQDKDILSFGEDKSEFVVTKEI